MIKESFVLEQRYGLEIGQCAEMTAAQALQYAAHARFMRTQGLDISTERLRQLRSKMAPVYERLIGRGIDY